MTEIHTASELEGIVTADAETAVFVAMYAEAKRAEDEAKARVEVLRRRVMEKFDASDGATKFAAEDGTVIVSRVEVQAPQAYDMDLLRRLAPKAVARATKPRSTFYRLNLPRLRRA